MILDSTLEFCDNVSVAASIGTALIGSQIDTSVVRNIGNGRPVYLVITVGTAIATAGTAPMPATTRQVKSRAWRQPTTRRTVWRVASAAVLTFSATAPTKTALQITAGGGGAGRWAASPVPPARPYWLGLLVVAMGVVWLYGASQLPQGARYAAVGPGLAVTIAGLGLVVLGVILMVR